MTKALQHATHYCFILLDIDFAKLLTCEFYSYKLIISLFKSVGIGNIGPVFAGYHIDTIDYFLQIWICVNDVF